VIPFRVILCLSALALLLTLCGCTYTPAHTFPDESVRRVEAQPDSYTEYDEYSVDLLTELSEAVVCVDVLEEAVDEPALRSVARVRIREVYKGELTVDEEILVQDSGYIREEGECTAEGEPLLRTGHRAVLFLTPLDDSSLYDLTGFELGKFFVDRDGLCYPAMALSARIKAGRPIASPSLDDWSPRTLEVLRREITDAF